LDAAVWGTDAGKESLRSKVKYSFGGGGIESGLTRVPFSRWMGRSSAIKTAEV
jgi:hypothetical protein